MDRNRALGRACHRWRALTACALLGIAAASCGGSSPAPAGGTVIGVTEHDFHITTTLSAISAGEVTLRVHNSGPDEHELIVAPDRGAGLPLRSDGFTINEEAIQNSEPGAINPQQPGGTQFLRLHLPPGRYVLFCNMEGHYMAGMHTELVVQ